MENNSVLCSCLLSVQNAFQGFSILVGELSKTQLILKIMLLLFCTVSLLFLLCVVPLGFFFFCAPLSGWLRWSSPVLCFVELASITAVFPLSPVLCQKLGRLVNVQDWSPPTARGWWRQWGCYVSLWLQYTLGLKVMEFLTVNVVQP